MCFLDVRGKATKQARLPVEGVVDDDLAAQRRHEHAAGPEFCGGGVGVCGWLCVVGCGCVLFVVWLCVVGWLVVGDELGWALFDCIWVVVCGHGSRGRRPSIHIKQSDAINAASSFHPQTSRKQSTQARHATHES